MQTKPDPKLSEVLAPAFADCGASEIGDALIWWDRLSGRSASNWMQPSGDVTINPCTFGDLRVMAFGLHAVSRIAQVLVDGGTDSAPAPWLSAGLLAAINGLAGALDEKLEALGSRSQSVR